MQNTIKIAKEIINQGKIEKTSANYFEVCDEIVRLERKPGRTLMTCTCKSCSRNINEPNNMCSRKIAVILFEAQNPRYKKLINDNEKYLKDCKKIKIEPQIDAYENLVNDMKEFL